MRVKLAAAVLRLPDGRFVFNRRDSDDPQAGGLIGLFNGGVEQGETPVQAIRRELTEETSLVVGQLTLKPLLHVEFPGQTAEGHGGGTSDIFLVDLPNDEFEVYEGGRETLSYDQAIEHPDVAPSLRQLLPKIKEMIYGA